MDTIWLLDFDGVINANRAGWSAAPRSSYAHSYPNVWKIRWAPQLIARIHKVHQAGVLIFWASSWCGETDQLERITKLPPLFSASRERMHGFHKRWAALDVLEAGNKLIWTDDEFTPEKGYMHDTMVRDGNALLIRPKANKGLRPADMDRIDAFIGV